MTEDELGNIIAKAVWRWLAAERCVELCPWVSNPKSDCYDRDAVIRQEGRENTLDRLEWCIREKLAECYAIRDDEVGDAQDNQV